MEDSAITEETGLKKIILATLLTLASTAAYANMQCGIKPIPPIGCSSSNAVCQCDSSGNCQWVFVGC